MKHLHYDTIQHGIWRVQFMYSNHIHLRMYRNEMFHYRSDEWRMILRHLM